MFWVKTKETKIYNDILLWVLVDVGFMKRSYLKNIVSSISLTVGVIVLVDLKKKTEIIILQKIHWCIRNLFDKHSEY